MEIWSAADDALISELRSRGLSYSQIAQRMGRSRNAVLSRAQRLDRPTMRVASPEDRARMIELAKQGMTDGAIATATGWSPSVVRGVRRRAGVQSQRGAGGASGRVVTPDERERLQAMRRAGLSVRQIAAETGWSTHAIEDHTAGCSPRFTRPKKRVRGPSYEADDGAVVYVPTVEDRWATRLNGRRFADAEVREPRGRLARVAYDHGLARSSMAYA